jgi:hypothetical protein
MEFKSNDLVAVTTNPFTGQQTVQDWQATYLEASVSMPKMSSTSASSWVTFLRALKGPLCVFVFPTALCAAFPNELTTDGSTPRYFRLKPGSQPHWQIGIGPTYSITFEIREAT